jgi:aspartyl-tRNA(Asn)/glutamyl-tRNA(Gln) amidotransferase subunit B
LRSYYNDNQKDIETINLQPSQLADLVALVDDGKVNFSVASTKILPLLFNNNKTPLQIAEEQNLLQTNDDNTLEIWVNTVLSNMPDKVAEYKKGKKGLIGLFVGEVKKLSGGKANPQTVTKLLQDKLQ